MSISYQQLLAFAESFAGIRAITRLEPLAGLGAKVFPPTYGVDDASAVSRYATEGRVVFGPDGGQTTVVESVVLDSVPAQAHAFSAELLAAVERQQLDLPLVGVDFRGEPGLQDYGVLTDLECPHRVYDAIPRDSLDGDVPFRFGAVGKAVTDATPRNATALYVHAPAALLFGAWDSTGPKGGRGSKFERAITSEIVATGIALGKATSSRIDPLGIEKGVDIYQTPDGWTLDPDQAPAGAKKVRPSEVNHGNIKPSIDSAAGGVTAAAIEATTVLSLIQLRRLGFPLNPDGQAFAPEAKEKAAAAARATLAALGLAATALAFEAGFDLRSRCVLAPTAALRFEAVDRAGGIEAFTLTGEEGLTLVADAAKAAAEAGLPWRAGLHTLKPTARLAELVRRSREAAEQSPPEAG
jgi:CRISPR-associated protein Csb1